MLYSVCTPLYLCVLRLYSFVPLVMSFPSSFCTPFAFVCTLTPFGQYHTIKKREEYKNTKACKYAPSIVLGARWPNKITTARAVAAAPVPLHAWTRSFAYIFAKHLTNSYILCSKGWGRACASPPYFPPTIGFQTTVDAWKSLRNVPKIHALGGGGSAMKPCTSFEALTGLSYTTDSHANTRIQFVLIAKCVKYLPSTDNWKLTSQSISNSLSTLKHLCETYQTVCARLYSFVPRLYSVCTARDFSSLGFLHSVCTPLYSCVLRLYSFVPLGMLGPLGFCTPFVLLCSPGVLRLYSFVPLGMSFPLKLLYSVCIRLYSHPVWRISVCIRLYSHPVWGI